MAGAGDQSASAPQILLRFLEHHLDKQALKTFRPVGEPQGFTLEGTDLTGAQLLGISSLDNGRTRQHLVVCLTYGGQYFWCIYLTDTVEADQDQEAALRANYRLLSAVSRSARIVQE